MKEKPYFLPEKNPSIVSDYFRVEIEQRERLRVIMGDPILKPIFFRTIEDRLQEARRQNGK